MLNINICQRKGLLSHFWLQKAEWSQWYLKTTYFPILSGILGYWPRENRAPSGSCLFTHSHRGCRKLAWPQDVRPEYVICQFQPHHSQLRQPGFWSEKMPWRTGGKSPTLLLLQDRQQLHMRGAFDKDAAAMGTRSGFVGLREGAMILFLLCYTRKFSCKHSVTTVSFSSFSG